MPAPVFPRGGVSSRAARTGRSRSGSSDRLSQSPPRASRSGRSRSAAGRARLPARPVLCRSLSGALFSGISPRSTAGCTGRRESASRTPGRPLPASRRARRLRGTQKRQPKTSCLFSMRKARTTARGMTFYVEGIFSFIMPPIRKADGHIAAALFVRRVSKLTVSPPFYRLFMQQNFPRYRALLSYRFFPAGAISTPGNFKRLRAAAFPWRFSVLIIPCPAPSRAMISFFRSCRFLWDSSACSPAVSEKRGPFPPTKKDRLVSGLFFYPFYPFCQSKKPSPM